MGRLDQVRCGAIGREERHEDSAHQRSWALSMYPRAVRQRRFWSSEEKRRMVAESFTPGASVSKVAQRYGVNANLSFTWRR